MRLVSRKLYTGLSIILLGIILANTTFLLPLSLQASFNPITQDNNDSILLLVEEGLLDGGIESKVNRYAEDIKINAKGADIKIVSVSEEEDPSLIAVSLKNQYFQEHLQGIVVIGNVPLPVVNKSGNRFISMYPYTDFEESAYFFNTQSNFFERNPKINDFEPEIWHGLIRFDTLEAYVDYFDKNHKYYQGEEGFADFEEKIFYMNPDMEARSLNSSLLGSYENYLEYGSEAAYNRYSNKLLADLASDFGADLDDSLGTESYASSMSELESSFLQIPDVQTKAMIDKYMAPVSSLFASALSDERAALLGIGRYNANDYFTPINLIAHKDEFYKQYLWDLSIQLEAEIDAIVEQEQRPVEIVNGAELKGTIYLRNGETVNIPTQYYVNNAFIFGSGDCFAPNARSTKEDIAACDLRVNANEEITKPEDCRIYRGGALGGDLAKTVEMWRKDFVIDYGTEDEQEICLKENITKRNARRGEIAEDNEAKCSLFYGQNVKDENHTKNAILEYKGQVTHEACFNMRPLGLFKELKDDHGTLQIGDVDEAKANASVNSEDIVLASDITLAQVLAALPNYKSDPKDWNAWSSYLLANPVQRSFTAENPLGDSSQVSRIVLEVYPIQKDTGSLESSAVTIRSVVQHKDPSPEIIQKAIEDKEILQLPVDEIRYTTFVDKAGNKQEIIYPSLFEFTSYEDLEQNLLSLEETLSGLSDNDYSGRLSSYVDVDTQATLENLFDWRDLSLTQKYTDILRSVLSLDQDNYVSTLPEDYEIAVLDTRADQDSLLYEILGENTFGLKPEILASGEDAAYEQAYSTQEEAEALALRNQRSLIVTYPLNEWITEYIPSWFEDMQNLSSITYPPNINDFVDLPSYRDLVITDNTELASIVLTQDYKDISLGSLSKFKINLQNDEGQLIVGEPLTVDLQVEGEAQLDSDLDDDLDQEGIQIFMTNGTDTIFFEPSQSGVLNFTVSYGDINQEIEFIVHESLTTQVSLEQNYIQAGSTETLSFSVHTLNEAGEKVSFQKPKISLDNPNLGSFSSQTDAEYALDFNYRFRPNTKSGRVNLNVVNPMTTPVIQELRILPGEASKLRFTEAETDLNTQASEVSSIELKAVDEYGNLVTQASNNLTVSLSNPDKISLLTSSLRLENGKAQIEVRSKANTFGNTFLKAESAGLDTAVHKLKLASKLTNSELSEMPLSALYLELLAPISGIDSLGQSLLQQGKSQVISTLSTGLEESAPLFYLHPNGAIEVINEQAVNTTLSFGETEIQLKAYDQSQRELARVKVNTFGSAYRGLYDKQAGISEAGVYLENLSDLAESELLDVVTFQDNGSLELKNNSYSFESASNADYFTLNLLEAGNIIARVIYAFDRPDAISLSPANHPTIQYTRTNTLSSSTDALGYKFYDPQATLSSEQLPSSNTLRLEDNIDDNIDLLSLREGHKSVMLFSAGQNAGSANRPYLSEAGIVFGDPLIQLTPTENFSVQNKFGYDLGEYLGRTNTPVMAILERDDYLILAEEDGSLSRLEKKTKELEEGFAKIPNGIKELKDFGDSLVILSKDACVLNDSCVYLLHENGEIESLDLELDSKAVQIFPADYTGDGDMDLAVLTDKKEVYLFLQTEAGVNPEGSFIASSTGKLQADQNLAPQLWLSDSLIGNSESAASGLELEVLVDGTSSNYSFRQLGTEQIWSGSSLVAKDLNVNTLKDGDILEYTLFLKNNSPETQSGQLSLPVSSNQEFIESSLSSPFTLLKSSDFLRPYLIKDVSIAPGASLQLKFQVKYHLTGEEDQAVINVVTDEEGYPADGLPDFRMQIPNTMVSTYYYSKFDAETNHLSYLKLEKSLGSSTVDEEALSQFAEPLSTEAAETSSSDLESALSVDSDGDGIADVYDTGVQNLDDLGDSIEGFIQENSCDGVGCLAIPHNQAFLVPNGPLPGTPIFGWACPTIIGVSFGRAANLCAGGRLYLSPTLTGELAGSVCLGPTLTGAPVCFTSRIGNLGSLCDTINDGIQTLMDGASEIIENANGGTFLNITGETPSETGVNIQVPGFPAAITNWVTAQMDEIQRSALDFPDLTLIYPDIQDLVSQAPDSENVEYQDIEGILASLNAMPLFNISTQTHYLKYPQIEPGELSKYKSQLTQVWDTNLQEINRAFNNWKCYGDRVVTDGEFIANLKQGDIRLAGAVGNECISLASTTLDIQASFQANLDNLTLYRDLPKNIFEAENFLAKYANSILGYADVILENTASYLSTNRAILLAWQDMFEDVNGLVSDFEVILDVFISYQDSCSSCRNTSSEDGWVNLMSTLGGVIPSPPVVKIPKMPNLTLDVSQVEANIDIVLPKFEFRPEKLVLPDLNGFEITLPEAPPANLEFQLPEFNLQVFPSIPAPPDLEKYLIGLPDLPEIQVPVLPTLPSPPEINIGEIGGGFIDDLELGLDALNKLLRIICLIKKGIIPVPENQIRSQIESLTARPLDVVLPIDLQAGFQFPDIQTTYLEEYKVNLETHFFFELDHLDEFASKVAEKFNAFQTNLNQGINQTTQKVSDGLSGELDLSGSEEALNITNESLENFSKKIGDFQESLDKLEQELPETLNLVATTKTISQPDFTGINLNRGFQIPLELQDQIETLVAYSEHPIEFSGDAILLADNSELPKLRSVNSITTSKFKIAQADTPDSGGSDLDFNPQSGLYLYDSETGVSENILAYKAESNESRQMLSTDLDKDRDDDLVYSRGNELFFKSNLDNLANQSIRSRVTRLDFADIRLSDTSSIEYTGADLSLSHEKAELNLEGLGEETLVIDVFKSSFSDEDKYQRFVIEPGETTQDFLQTDTLDLSDSFTLRKEGFETINYQKNSQNKIRLELDNQAYIATIQVYNPNENILEVLEPRLPLTPNICGDKSGPEIIVEQGTDIEVSVANPIDIDVSGSSDHQTAIAEVYLDLNLNQDSDNDGNLINDRDLQGSGLNQANTHFRLNPVNETKDFQIAVWVIDLAGNASYQIITIHVLAPDIILDSVSSGRVSGHLDPIDDNVPLNLIRQRAGVLKELANTKTDDLGEFTFEDLLESDNLQVLNQEQEVLFLINKKTGSIQSQTETASYKVVPAIAGESPTFINLYEGSTLITQLLRVADSNQDVEIMTGKPNDNDLLASQGVTVVNKSRLDKYKVEAIPGNDKNFPGAAALSKDGQRQAVIDTNGSIILINSEIKLELEAVDDLSDLQWFVLSENDKEVAYIYISPSQKELEIGFPEFKSTSSNSSTSTEVSLVEESLVENETTAPIVSSVFNDISTDDPDYDTFMYLNSLGVLNGVNRDGVHYLEPDRLLSRAEYASVILKIMCIEPREESYQAPQAFSDIPYQSNLDWYYALTKETKLQGLFEGYLGEVNSLGLAPFKPNNTINRAEALKVILEALELKGVVDLSTLVESSPWYIPYVNISRNIRSITVDSNYSGTNYLISAEQSQAPLMSLSRREFARIANNTLLVKNCLTEDLDQDGIPYHYEVENGLNPNQADSAGDQDGDGTSNLDEYNNERIDSTNENSSDRTASLSIEPGLYIKDIPCSTCPCLYRLEYETDIMPEDIIFVILKNPDTKAILRRSNILTY